MPASDVGANVLPVLIRGVRRSRTDYEQDRVAGHDAVTAPVPTAIVADNAAWCSAR